MPTDGPVHAKTHKGGDAQVLGHSAISAASARFWNRHARKYANNKIGDPNGYERSLARTRDYLTRNSHVLEIGCGTGTTALSHAPHLKHITGTDIAAEMIAIANEKAGQANALNAEFIIASAQDLPFSDNAFDVVMAHNVYHLVEDVDRALSEAWRVTAPGGVLITKTPLLGEMNVFMRHAVLPIMRRWFAIPVVHTLTASDFETFVAAAGYEIEAIENHASKGRDTRPFIVARKPGRSE